MIHVPSAVTELTDRLAELRWVHGRFVAGSLATGDYVQGVSDLDLVALTDGSIDELRRAILMELHQDLNRGVAIGLDLGCAYVDVNKLADGDAEHPTWTHGSLVRRLLSGVTRAELVRYGYA